MYFRDKYDLRNKLIVHKAAQLFEDAYQELQVKKITDFEEQVMWIMDYFIKRFRQEHNLLRFISKNLSWGIFKNTLEQNAPEGSVKLYDYYLSMLKTNNIVCQEPELMLFTFIELVSSTCYNCILFEQPVSMDKYLPYLHKCIHQIFLAYTT